MTIRAHGLTKAYGPITAVDNLTFAAPAGAVTALVGPPGAGKTTTLAMLLELVNPTAGEATVIGDAGAVLGAPSAHPRRTALAHLKIYAAALAVPDSRAYQVLSLVGLSGAADVRVHTFDPGMRTRLALATALLGNPRVLLLDEPVAGLDGDGVVWLRNLLRAFAERGGTVLMTSASLRAVERLADRLVILRRGAAVYTGTFDDLRYAHRGRVFVTASDPARLAVALAARGATNAQLQPDGRLAVADVAPADIDAVAVAAGVQVHAARVEQVDLEQVFLGLTAPQFAPATPQFGGPLPGVPR